MTSKNDGDQHYIGVAMLLRLYRIPRSARVVSFSREGNEPLGFRDRPGDVHLYPDYSGRYELSDGGIDPQMTILGYPVVFTTVGMPPAEITFGSSLVDFDEGLTGDT